MGKEPKPIEDERLKKELEEKGLDEEGRAQDPPPLARRHRPNDLC
jgi:hypothetical protein